MHANYFLILFLCSFFFVGIISLFVITTSRDPQLVLVCSGYPYFSSNYGLEYVRALRFCLIFLDLQECIEPPCCTYASLAVQLHMFMYIEDEESYRGC